MIANDKSCTHVKTGGNPSFCVKQEVPSIDNCESSCTSYHSCVGFSYEKTKKQRCHLWVSDKTCPLKFRPGSVQLESALTMNDLRGDGQAGHVCYGKNEGTICCR